MINSINELNAAIHLPIHRDINCLEKELQVNNGAEGERIYIYISKVLDNCFFQKIIDGATLMNNEHISHFSFQQKIDYERTLNYTWSNEGFIWVGAVSLTINTCSHFLTQMPCAKEIIIEEF